MRRARLAGIALAALLGSTVGCSSATTDGPAGGEQVGTVAGQLRIDVPPSPGEVTFMQVVVTAPDMVVPVRADLVQQPDSSWTGSVIGVPPGTGRTVSVAAFDVDLNNIFSGSTSNVTVYAGSFVNVPVALEPVTGMDVLGANTPPHFIAVIAPQETRSTEPVTFFAIADDPDPNTQLTYIYSVLSGGGSFSTTTVPSQTPGNAISTVYTPMAGFTGFAVIQVAVTDGRSTATSTFPIAIKP